MKKNNKIALLITVLLTGLLLTCFSARICVMAAEYDADLSCVFDVDYYYDNNPDVAEALGYDADKLWEHFLNNGMREGRQASVAFDPKAYKQRYGDLSEAFGGEWQEYYLHYAKTGRYEGRSGTTISSEEFEAVFEAQNYMNRNLDVRLVYGDDTDGALFHFIANGMKEGRQACNSFDVKAYKEANEDLEAAFGDDYESYYKHYIFYGQYENRVTVNENSVFCGNGNMQETYSVVFNAKYYLTYNPDVKEAFGNDATIALKHFISDGMKEGRRGSNDFDVRYYAANNPDLQSAFGENLQEYYLHYIRCGCSEGRAAKDPDEPALPVYYDLEDGAIGIDVSSWQEEIDWEAVKADGISFAIIRIGRGFDSAENNNQETGFDDIYATYNMNECERLGIPYGVYLYSYATNVDQAYAEVEHIERLLGGRNPRMGVYIDIESSQRYEDADIDIYSDDGRRLVTDLTKIILRGISNAGFNAGWYANLNYCRNVLYIDELSGYRWIAGYNHPDYEPEVREKGALIWQYTSSGSVDGISDNVDMDRLMQGISF
jgi:GH25 family lysozyme M1 (1,4-beta-N-acetylmuramidase)